MEPSLITKEEFQVIGMEITCDWSLLSTEMPRLWKVFRERAAEIKNAVSDCMIDVSLQVVGDQFTQVICMEVSDLDSIPQGMVGLTIPKQSYAYMEHEGAVEDIWKSFGELQEWIKERGYTRDPLDFKLDYCPSDPKLSHGLYQKIV